jgi:NADH-quinone oxidoreductase subunit C
LNIEILKEKFKEKIKDVSKSKDGKDNVLIEPSSLLDVATFLKENGFESLNCISGMDYGDDLGVVYHFYSFKEKKWIVLKVKLNKESPSVSSLYSLYKTSDWQEREVYDMFGINFTGHPNLKRILLTDDWIGYPLRKDYEKQTKDVAYREVKENARLGKIDRIVEKDVQSTST